MNQMTFAHRASKGLHISEIEKNAKDWRFQWGKRLWTGKGVKRSLGEADTKMQIPVQTALEAALCELGFHTIKVSGQAVAFFWVWCKRGHWRGCGSGSSSLSLQDLSNKAHCVSCINYFALFIRENNPNPRKQ